MKKQKKSLIFSIAGGLLLPLAMGLSTGNFYWWYILAFVFSGATLFGISKIWRWLFLEFQSYGSKTKKNMRKGGVFGAILIGSLFLVISFSFLYFYWSEVKTWAGQGTLYLGLLLVVCLAIFVIWKIVKLLVKIYKKIDRWADRD